MWSEEDRTQRMQKIHYLDVGEKKKKKDPLSSQGPISEVYAVGSKHLFTRGCFFPGPSLRDREPWSGSTAAPQQSGCGYTAQTSGPFDITLRNHEVRGRLFLPRHKGVIFHSPRENSGE